MFELLKRILKHSTAYAIGTILNRAVSIVLLPLYTRYLLKSEYGVLEILLVTSSVIMLLFQLGLGSALFRSIIYKDNVDRKVLISTAYYFLAFISTISIFILCLNTTPISKFLFGSLTYANTLIILFIGDFFLVLNTVPMALLRIKEQSVKFAIINSFNFAVGIILNIIFVVILKRGVEGIVLANTITAFLFFIIYLLVLWDELELTFSFIELRDMLGFGLPLVPSSIGDMVLMLSDRYILRYFRGLEDVGSYSAAIRLSMIVALTVNAFQMAWPAILFSIVKEDNAEQTFARLFDYFLFVLAFVALGLSLFSSEIIRIITTPKFIDGAKVVPLIALSYLFYGIYYYSSIGIQVHKKTFYLPIIIGFAAFISLSLNFYLIPKYGFIGAGISRVISTSILGFSILFISLKYYFIPYSYFNMLKLFFVGFVLFSIGFFCVPTFSITNSIFKLILWLAFPILLFLIRFFTNNDLMFLRKSLQF